MALDTNSFPATQVGIVAEDYTGSPLSVSFSDVLTGDVSFPQERPRETNSLFVNSTSTGKVHAGEPENGQADPPTWSFTFWEIDSADNTEVSSPLGLIKALSQNSVAGTAFSSHVFTSQLTLGGKLQAKFVVTIVNEGGVSHAFTIPSIVEKFTSAPSGGARMITVNLKVVGAITGA